LAGNLIATALWNFRSNACIFGGGGGRPSHLQVDDAKCSPVVIYTLYI
jgi:hypothetical protein